jgi:hypothetical protein
VRSLRTRTDANALCVVCTAAQAEFLPTGVRSALDQPVRWRAAGLVDGGSCHAHTINEYPTRPAADSDLRNHAVRLRELDAVGTRIKTALLPAPFLVCTIGEEIGPLRPAIAGATASTGVSDPREQPALALLVEKPARDRNFCLRSSSCVPLHQSRPTGLSETSTSCLRTLALSAGLWRETDEPGTNRATLVRNLLEGQYENPVRIVAFNTAEGWSRDVTLGIADELRRSYPEFDEVPASVLGFLETTNRH